MKENKNAWENIYKNNMSYLKYPNDNLVSLFFNIKSMIPSDGKFLDFGCGSGNNAEFLSNYFQEFYAVDIANSSIELTRKRLNRMDSIYNLNFDTTINSSFRNLDFILAWQSLYYNSKESFIESFQELINCLKPNGIIIFSLLNIEDIKVENSTQINTFDYKINSTLKSQENCRIFALHSYEQLLELLNIFSIDIVDYGQFCRYSKKTSGTKEYYIIGKKHE